MGVIKQMKEMQNLTEREKDICQYILSNPEKIEKLSSMELGQNTYTSAASVVRFCQKIGCKGYLDFRIQFVSDLKSSSVYQDGETLTILEKENVVSVIQKMEMLEQRAIELTKKELSIEQMVRVSGMVHRAEYLDFYAYDVNVHLAQYACSQFFHAGKIANTYIATNVQELHSLIPKKNHLGIIISHSGENSRLLEVVKGLKMQKTKTIVITTSRGCSLAKASDEFLYAAATSSDISTGRIEDLWTSVFFSSAKYILDILFTMEFSNQYDSNIALNKKYEKIGHRRLWALENDF